ncbi:hypothetical protein EV2_015548 [Malus domestica]
MEVQLIAQNRVLDKDPGDEKESQAARRDTVERCDALRVMPLDVRRIWIKTRRVASNAMTPSWRMMPHMSNQASP